MRDGEMAFALGAFQDNLIAVAGHAGNPGKDIAFHARHNRARPQHLLCHAVFAHQLADNPEHGIVAVTVIKEPGAIAAQQNRRQGEEQQQDQAAPQTAIATLLRRIGGRRRGRGGRHGHGVIAAQALD